MRGDGYPAAFSFFIHVEVVGLSGGLFALVFAVNTARACTRPIVPYSLISTVSTSQARKCGACDKTVQDLAVCCVSGRQG